MENRIAWEAAVSFAVAVLLLLIICDIIAELFIAALFVSAIIGISILFILPDKTMASSSSSLFSSWLNDGVFRPDMEASNARNRIKTMLAAIVEGIVVLCLMLNMKKMDSYTI